tara:strand:- start:257 stop:505 length:249 start_codon:yes stop_codon:yes gene_type:complete
LFGGRSYRKEGDVAARSPSNHTHLLPAAKALLLEGDIASSIVISTKVSPIQDLYTINPFVIFVIPNDSFDLDFDFRVDLCGT